MSVLTASAVAQVAPVAPRVTAGSGLVLFTFALPEGTVTAHFTNDVAPGERFSGTLDGPKGFVLASGDQRARTGGRFRWEAPKVVAEHHLPLVLLDSAGRERGRSALLLSDRAAPDSTFRFPALIQAGQPFPVRGRFDGNSKTTSVKVGGARLAVIAESHGKAVMRAPHDAVGPATGELTKGGRSHRQATRAIAIDLAAVPDAGREVHAITIKGLAGVDGDIPLQIGGRDLYVRASEVPANGTFSLRRAFAGASRDLAAKLVIPQSRRDDVAVILRTPLRVPGTALARQHGDDLRALDFDALPIAADLLADFTIGNDAAYAMVAMDEARALSLIFASMPQSGLQTQLVGFTWFLEHQGSSRAAGEEGRDAARRVLRRVLSTASAQLAVYVLGLTGSEADIPLLEQFYSKGGPGEPLREASEASLIRLGSRPHLERMQAELAMPLPANASYRQGANVTRMLRTAGLAGRPELVPGVCEHVTDPLIREIDIFVDPGRSAVTALSAIVDGTSPVTQNASARSSAEWSSYCGRLPR